MTLSWRAADGTETDLDDAAADFFVVRGPVGLDAPSPVNTIEDFAAFDGGTRTNLRRTVRQVLLPFFVTHATRVQTAISQLVRLLQGPGELVWADDTNLRYLRDVVYEGGLGGDLSLFNRTGDRRVVASLLAMDPWWYGPPELFSLPATASSTPFDAPIDFDAAIPFNGGTSVSIPVDGDTDALPVVTVWGPATSVTLTGDGLEWQTAVELGAADVLVVDTRPSSRGPRLNGGRVDWSLLTEESRLWTLPAGDQAVVISVIGGTGATLAQLEISPRWLTP